MPKLLIEIEAEEWDFDGVDLSIGSLTDLMLYSHKWDRLTATVTNDQGEIIRESE